jgi:hypothetical protein
MGRLDQARVEVAGAIANEIGKQEKGLITQEELQQRALDANKDFLSVAESVYDSLVDIGAPTSEVERLIRATLGSMEDWRDLTKDTADQFDRIGESAKKTAGSGILSGVSGLERSRGPSAGDTVGASGAPSFDETGGMDLSAIAGAAGGAIAGAAASIVSGLGDVVSKLVNIFKQAIVGSEAVKTVMDNLKSGVATALEPAANALANAIRPMVPVITQLATSVGQLLIPVFRGFGMILQGIMPALNALNPIFSQLAALVQSVFLPVWNQLGKLVAAQLVPVLQILASLIQYLNPFLQIWSVLMQTTVGLMRIFVPVLNVVATVFGKLADVVKGLWNNALMPFGNMILNLARNLAQGIDGIINGIINEINSRFGTDISNINISDRVPDNLRRIGDGRGNGRRRGSDLPDDGLARGPKRTRPEAPDSGVGSTSTGRTINQTITINTDVIAGEGGIRDLAILIRDEIRAAEALGA